MEYYRKKYNEVLERLKSLIKNDTDHIIYEDDILERVPELRESEDERMIQYFKDLAPFDKADELYEKYGFSHKDAIAWLEKQGQKPTDKVETKFHEGDWVILTAGELSTTLQIVKVDTNKKLYWFNDSSYLPIVDEECLHFWSIQDAKAGDVLEFGDHGRLVVGIVSFISKRTGRVDVSCLLEANNFKVGNYYALDTINPHPATKEQCDLLFQKMHEDGYQWDAEKKELKKIEQKPVKVPKFKAGDFIQFNGMGHTRYTIKEVCGLSHYINTCNKRMDMSYTDANFELVEQKPAEWSEEERQNVESIIAALTYCNENGVSDCFVDPDILIDWLKSLRPQSHWKPSTLQIEALESATENCAYSEYQDCLRELAQQLKKL